MLNSISKFNNRWPLQRPGHLAAYNVQLGQAVSDGPLIALSDAELARRMAHIKSMGCNHIRTDLDWRVCNTAEDVYSWTAHDRIYDYAAAAGLSVTWVMHRTPGWCNGSAASNVPPTDIWRYGVFATAAGNHYNGSGGRTVRRWEIWNEPNLAIFMSVQGASLYPIYTDLLAFARNNLKAVSADNFIIGGGLSCIPSGETFPTTANTSTDDLISNTCDNLDTYFSAVRPDAWSFHPYCYPYSPSLVQSWTGYGVMRACALGVLTTKNPAAKISPTEYGAPTGGGVNAVSERTQAQHLYDLLSRMKQEPLNYDPILYIYTYRNAAAEASNNTEDHFGATTAAGRDKPLVRAMASYGLR